MLWASTAADFICGAADSDPDERLQTVIRHDVPDGRFDVDEFYTLVLADAGPWSNDKFRHAALTVLGAVVLETLAMTEKDLDTLLYG